MPPNLKNSTYVGAFVFGGEARQQLRRAEEALELWAAHLNLVQVRLGIARDLIAESRYSVAAVEDALKVLSVVQRANAEAIDTADIALTPPA